MNRWHRLPVASSGGSAGRHPCVRWRAAAVRRLAFLGLLLAVALLPPAAGVRAASPGGAAEGPSCVTFPGVPQGYDWSWAEAAPGELSLRVGQTLVAQARPAAPAAAPPVGRTEFSVCARLHSADDPLVRPLPLRRSVTDSGAVQLTVQLRGAFPFWVRRPAQVALEISGASPLAPPLLRQAIVLSERGFCVVITLAFMAVFYGLLAKGVHDFYAPQAAGDRRLPILRHLDPIVVSAGGYGSASLANLQIFWFTLIVVGLLVYAWLVTGSILNPSADVLWLLGIASGTKVVAEGIGSFRQRLSLDNSNWLELHRLLRNEQEINPAESARWRDLVLANGTLEPSRYQLLVFGFLIGISLLFGNISVIQSFEVPEFFRTLQGLSSGFYLFGKAVSPNAIQELEQRITDLRSREAPLPLSEDDRAYLRSLIASIYGPAAVGEGLAAA
jgi:hypothetical protein